MRVNLNGRNIALVFYMIFVVGLTGCTGEVGRPAKLNQLGPSAEWKIDIVHDECSVANFVYEYINNGPKGVPNRKYGSDSIRQDRHAFLRLRYRAVDWNLLDYIISQDNYKFYKDCQSTFSLSRGNSNSMSKFSLKYNFRSINSDLFCVFRNSKLKLRKAEINKVQSCINTNTDEKTFDVIEIG